MSGYRKNIFLHFLNRDVLQICGWYRENFPGKVSILSRCLNAAVMLSEEYCLAPPGFFIESDESLTAIRCKSNYLENRLIRLPMRELSYCDFAEKKRLEYSNVAPLYKGLFDDTQIEYLSLHAHGVLYRNLHIGKNATKLWEEGPDKNNSPMWKSIKATMTPQSIGLVHGAPGSLTRNGKALTWFGMLESVPPDISKPNELVLRQLLQHNYFSLYIDQYSPAVLDDIPRIPISFGLDTICTTYNYELLVSYLSVFRLGVLLDADDLTILSLRKHHGFINFIDTFVCLTSEFRIKLSSTDIISICGSFVCKSSFDWINFSSNWGIKESGEYYISESDILELVDACDDISNEIQSYYGISLKNERANKASGLNPKPKGDMMISIFVSHSKKDESLASSFVRMITSCIVVDSGAIRCSSVPGYKFTGSTHVSSQIRKEINESSIVLGFISKDSINSDYVLFELGAGWLLEKSTALLNKQVDYKDIPGPLNECHALKLEDSTDLISLIQLISDKCGFRMKDINVINQEIKIFLDNL